MDCVQAYRLVAAVCQTAAGLDLVVPLENGRADIHNVQGGGTREPVALFRLDRGQTVVRQAPYPQR